MEDGVITVAQVTHIKCIGKSNRVKLFSFYCSLWVEKFEFQKVKNEKKRDGNSCQADILLVGTYLEGCI